MLKFVVTPIKTTVVPPLTRGVFLNENASVLVCKMCTTTGAQLLIAFRQLSNMTRKRVYHDSSWPRVSWRVLHFKWHIRLFAEILKSIQQLAHINWIANFILLLSENRGNSVWKPSLSLLTLFQQWLMVALWIIRLLFISKIFISILNFLTELGYFLEIQRLRYDFI